MLTTMPHILKQPAIYREWSGNLTDPWSEFAFGHTAPLSDNSDTPGYTTWDTLTSMTSELRFGTRSKLDNPALLWFGSATPKHIVDANQALRNRLGNANAYFRRRANEVANDSISLELLNTMYNGIVVDVSDVDVGTEGIPLAKLAAANFCEIGAKVIYITDAGMQFIHSLPESWLLSMTGLRNEAALQQGTEL